MAHLIFPEKAIIRIFAAGAKGEHPFRVPNVVFCVRTFARLKNDYKLAPFFSDSEGVVTITRELCEIYAAAELDTGLMDYRPISDCFPLVEIYYWSEEELERAIEGRKTWGLLSAERQLWSSVDELINKYRTTANRLLRSPIPGVNRIRDEWDGSKDFIEYKYYVNLK
ncbi:MAG: hypothetical protein KY468_10935 [Armatimonadetes bacterium]|nr:hypothetical protein [Armatimonadota bacterium]